MDGEKAGAAGSLALGCRSPRYAPPAGMAA